MNYNKRLKKGFSLTEVLLAVGTLAVGMLFVAGTFVVAVHFATLSTERTTAAVAADEAFSKMRLFSVVHSSLAVNTMHRYFDVTPAAVVPNEFSYPSTDTAGEKQYFWSAICRRIEDPNRFPASRLVQTTVFVSRKVGVANQYPLGAMADGTVDRPVAVRVPVTGASGSNTIVIAEADVDEAARYARWFTQGTTLVDDRTGWIYRVVDVNPAGNELMLDRNWDSGVDPEFVWVVPPPVNGGRYPCIAVYQRLMRL